MARRVAPLVAVLAVAALSSLPAWFQPVRWTPDGFFYEARVLVLRGAEEEAAVRTVLDGPLVADARGYTDSAQLERLRDDAWVDHTTSITRRRLFVPLLAAGVYPLLGDSSLQAVSVLGYAVFAGLLYLLLRRRFSATASAAVAIGVALLPPVREWSFVPLTDSWGLALQTGALLGAVQVLERGARWLPLWVLTLLPLSFTRDSAAIAVAGAAWVALHERTRTAAALVATGVAAALPAPLLFDAPVSNTVGHNAGDPGAYWASLVQTLRIDVLGGLSAAHIWPMLAIGAALAAAAATSRAPRLGSVGLRICGAYLAVTLGATAVLATRDVDPVHAVPAGIVLVAGLALLFAPGSGHDPYVRLVRAAAVASVLYVLIWPVPSGQRLLLPLLPVAAVGFARVLDLRQRAPLGEGGSLRRRSAGEPAGAST
jgi:hypothetical protein